MRLRVSKDGHKLSQTEINRRFQDRHSSIDAELDEAISNINWARRNECEKDIVKWVTTYCKGILIDDDPPEKGEKILHSMYDAIESHNNYMILMGRGNGKSTYAECIAMNAMSTGKQKYMVVISNNGRSASNMLKDFWKMISEKDTAYAQDYPTVCLPYQLTNGSLRRRQIYKGISTELSKTATDILFPRLKDDDGNEYPSSGSIITVRSITSGIRGMKKGTLRPSCVLLDDLQDSEIAHNPDQVQKVLDIIKKDIMPLAGKERLSIIQTATPIVADDLVEHIRKDPYWKTTLYPSIISYPKNKALWEEYFRIYDAELVGDEDHKKSLNYYKDHLDAMNEGSEVFNPTRYSEKDGHISAIQKLLELEHNLGKAVFQAEYQMKPQKQSYVVEIFPSTVAKKLNGLNKLEIPDEYRYVTYGIDINPSYAISVVGIAWKINTTGIVFFKKKFPVKIDQKLPDSAYNQKVYQELEKILDEIKTFNLKVSGIAIDCGGRQWDAVNLFCKQYKELPVCAFAGRSATQFLSHMYSRTRLKDAIGRTVLCGDEAERTLAGSGCKYVFFDADWTKHSIQQGFNTVVGDIGSISLYGDDKEEHTDFSIEVSNEKITSIQHKADGRDIYNWSSKEPHDDLDCCSMCRAVLSQLGITSNTFKQNFTKSNKLRVMKQKKRRLKIV